MTERQTFSAEFKREAVRLLESGDRKAAALARDLGVRRNLLYKWRDEIRSKGDDAFSRKPGPKPARPSPAIE
ncbi:transposase [Salinisphaera shabanensis]|uniref:transposase n=1 Tax=Salinisphaera shabanensis TaxID=180542 RepID=UPI003341EFF1